MIAANRDPKGALSKSLEDLPKGDGSALIVVAYDAGREQSAFDVAREIREMHAIEYLDIVVPNAAISTGYPLVKDVKRATILEHVEINTLSVVSLFQATRDLLQKSARPVFAPMGSGAGYLGYGFPPKMLKPNSSISRPYFLEVAERRVLTDR